MNKLVGTIFKEIAVGVGINVLATKVLPKLAEKAREKAESWKKEQQDAELSVADSEETIVTSVSTEESPQKEVYVYNAKWK